MDKTFRSLWVTMWVVVAVALSSVGAAAGDVAPELAAKIAGVDSDDFVRVIIRMEERPFVTAAMGSDAVQFILKETAARTQAPVVEFLRTAEQGGRVRAYKDFWIINAVFAELEAGLVESLARLPGVDYVYEDFEIHAAPIEVTEVDAAPAALRWDHLGATFAREVWEKGYRGQGITVAVIDTGVDLSHPELTPAFGGSPPYYEGYWAEFDRNGDIVPGSTPHDNHGHGTHVSGTVAARNVNYEFSVAPEATLAHGLVLPGGTGSLPQLLAGMQWVAEQRFDVINGSLGATGTHPDMATATDNLAAAGVVPIFANGNLEPDRPEVQPPGMPGNTPSAIAVGGYDADGEEAYYNQGDIVEYPGYEYDEFTRIKPDISAPGVDILSAWTQGRYAYSNGTSMASPHVAGAVALILSVRPDLTVDEVRQLLYESTGGHEADFGWEDVPTKDIHFGWGRLNVLKAVEMIESERPTHPQARVHGRVVAADGPLTGATVAFAGAEDVVFAVDERGEFRGEVSEGFYTVTAAAPGYRSESRSVTIANTGAPVEMNFLLEPAPLGSVIGRVVDGADGRPLAGVSVSVVDADEAAETDDDGRYELSLPEGAYSIAFAHPGFFAETVEAQVAAEYAVQYDVELTFGHRTQAGTVVDGKGDPVAGAEVRVVTTEEHLSTDEEGGFVLDLPAGPFDVEFAGFGFLTKRVPLDIQHGVVAAPITVELAYNAGTVAGRVVDTAGDPVAGATVSIDELDIEGATDEDGTFALYPVTVGRWYVGVDHPDFWPQGTPADVAFDDTTELTFRLQSRNREVLFFNTFDTEEEQAQWTLINTVGRLNWEFTQQRSVSAPFSAYHGSLDEGGNHVAELSSMISPVISIPEEGADLTFNLWGEAAGLFGVGVRIIDPDDPDNPDLLFAYGNETDRRWMEVMVNLDDYAGQDIQIEYYIEGLLFMFGEGIYIDDVMVHVDDPLLGGSVGGVVTDEQGKPIAGATVTVVQQAAQGDPVRTTQVTTDEQGAYNVDVVPGGWTVHAGKVPEYDAVSQEVYVEPDAAATVDFRLPVYVAPGPVDGLQARPGDGTVTLSWHPLEGAALYRVHRSVDGEHFHVIGATFETEFTADKLQNGHTYYFRVTAMDRYEMEGPAASVAAVPGEFGPQIEAFDVHPRTLRRGGSFLVTAELGHADDPEAPLDVRLEAALGDRVVREWTYAGLDQGAFEAVVDANDVFGRPWAPNIYQMTLYATDGAGDTNASSSVNVAVLAPLPGELSFVLGDNPFNPAEQSQRIEYSVPADGRVTVAVYSLDGRRVRTLFDGTRRPGDYVAYWDGADETGRIVLSGMYVVRVQYVDADGGRTELVRHSVVVK